MLPRSERGVRYRRANRTRHSAHLKLSGSLATFVVAVLVTGASASGTVRPADQMPDRAQNPPGTVMNTNKGTSKSTNWSGYAVTGGTFSSVAASWVVPSVSCPNQAQGAAFWVGIDGYASSDHAAEQTGTDSDCLKGNKKKPGGPSYYAWWEIVTPSSTSSSTIGHGVCPGDQMSAGVSGAGDSYTLTLTDSSTCSTRGPWSFTTTQAPSATPAASSAEWIAEAPGICASAGSCKTEKLSDFGSVTFNGASANGVGLSSYATSQVHAITMAKGKTVKAEPYGLSSSSFGVAWEHN